MKFDSLYQFITYLKKTKPRSSKELLGAGVKMRCIGEGAFRTVWVVRGFKVVIKFPDVVDYTEDTPAWGENIDHSRAELRALKRYRHKKYKIIWGYLPRVYYSDHEAGVIVMEKYNRRLRNNFTLGQDNILEKMFESLLGLYSGESDICPYNLAVDDKGQIKIIDLGCCS